TGGDARGKTPLSAQPGLTIAEAVRRVTEAYQEARRKVERREAGRVEFIQPVRVTAEDGREFTLLTRDLSASGIRLIGTRRLLGQRLTVRVSGVDFVVRVLWACPVGDDLVENGGTFLGVSAQG
ncbi:MAG: PilZ domain-containing protein, partial [Gemmataceae bacterium]